MTRALFHLVVPMLLLVVLAWELACKPARLTMMPAHQLAKETVSQAAPRLGAETAGLLARPLFSPTRRPALAAARAVPQPPRLSGIVVTGSDKYAIFIRTGGNPMIAARGQLIGAFKVREITTTQVIVSGPNGVLTLHTSDPDAGSDGASRAASGPANIRSPVTLPGGITLYPATAENLPQAADWPGTKD